MSAVAEPRSLLASLFLRVAALFIAVVGLIGAATFTVTRASVEKMYDDQLLVGARVLRFLMSDELKEAQRAGRHTLERGETSLLSSEDERAFGSYVEWRMFRVWSGETLVLNSGSGPHERRAPTEAGFRNLRDAGTDWRLYVLKVPEHDVTVEVGETVDTRRAVVRHTLLAIAAPLALLVPITAALIWAALRGGLQALRALLQEMARRSPRDLSPMGFRSWPRELHPLIRAVNGLLDRIAGSLRHERRFLDDAAHQLRTPLAGVKLQAQMIAREGDPAERQILVAGLLASVDRAAALTDDLLTLARLDAGDVAQSSADGDLGAETAAALADLAPLAASRGVALSFEGAAGLSGGSPVLLRLVAANLVENAIHHAPPGTEVEVRVGRAGGVRRLVVADRGCGIPPADREQVLGRFHRGRSANAAGSGLGLSIVVAALDLLDGSLRLESRDDGASGLRAAVELPDPA